MSIPPRRRPGTFIDALAACGALVLGTVNVLSSSSTEVAVGEQGAADDRSRPRAPYRPDRRLEADSHVLPPRRAVRNFPRRPELAEESGLPPEILRLLLRAERGEEVTYEEMMKVMPPTSEESLRRQRAMKALGKRAFLEDGTLVMEEEQLIAEFEHIHEKRFEVDEPLGAEP